MKYKCKVCGYIHDEEKEGKSIFEMEFCPVCHAEVSNLKSFEESYKIYKCEICGYIYDEKKEGKLLSELD